MPVYGSNLYDAGLYGGTPTSSIPRITFRHGVEYVIISFQENSEVAQILLDDNGYTYLNISGTLVKI